MFTNKTPKPTKSSTKRKPSGIETLRERERRQKAEQRAAASVIRLPECADKERRKRLEADDVAWLMHYFGPESGCDDPFTYQFVPQQLEMIKAVGEAMRNGGDQSIAASRGEGKTLIAERLATKYVLTGDCDYVVIFAATGPAAQAILHSIANYCETNQLLAADYPEVCIPVRNLEGAVQRARSQRANGTQYDNGVPYTLARLRYSWCGDELTFPHTPGSPSAGAIIATRGLDAAVRGLRKGRRPKLAIIDDPDTEQTAASEEQAAKLLKRIDATIGGLGGQRQRIGRVVLTTIQSRVSASFVLTDRTQRPNFKGRRYRWLVTPPDRLDLWDEYVSMRQEDGKLVTATGENVDPECRRSNAFYLANREEMQRGAVVANPNRHNDAKASDGSQMEADALQAYFNLVADLGPVNVATEYDNDPPTEEAAIDTSLTPQMIQRRVNGEERRIVPAGYTLVTCGVDVRKIELHWVLRAWRQDGSGHTLDYGTWDVVGTRYGSDDGVDEAIRKAITGFAESLLDNPPQRHDGEIVPVALTLVDSGWRSDAVYAACAAVRGFMPSKGFGRSSGTAGANFSEYRRRSADIKPGDGWFLSRQKGLWLACLDADRWKNYEQDRWLTPIGNPGAFTLWGVSSEGAGRMTVDESSHSIYARHLTNEREMDELHKGHLRRVWKTRSEYNHFLDASVYATVAAQLKGMTLATGSQSVVESIKRNGVAGRPSLAQLARRK
jgi:hypothetical protein